MFSMDLSGVAINISGDSVTVEIISLPVFAGVFSGRLRLTNILLAGVAGGLSNPIYNVGVGFCLVGLPSTKWIEQT